VKVCVNDVTRVWWLEGNGGSIGSFREFVSKEEISLLLAAMGYEFDRGGMTLKLGDVWYLPTKEIGG